MVTTFSGVGNLTKLSHLRHLTKLNKLKVVIGTVEVSSASASLMLRYSDNCGEKVFCQKLTTYLFWLEMMSLSADVITQQMLKKSAKEALAVADNRVDIRVKKELAKFANEGSDLLSSLKRKFSNKLNEVQWSKFEADFGNKVDVLKKFDDNPGLVEAWRFLDDAGVDDAIRKNVDALADPDAALDAIQASGKAKPTWPEIQALFKRGNDFNKKGRFKYGDNFVEAVLKGVDGKAGKRLDTYLPSANGRAGQIISRKATTLSEIQPTTFRNYLNELITKYPKGAELNSSKFPSGTTLDGDYFLEIPTSNKSFFESSTEFQKVLNDFNTSKGVDIKIKYLDE